LHQARRFAPAGFGLTFRSAEDNTVNPHQIVVLSQGVLDIERSARRGVGVSSARGQHTKGPIIFGVLIRNAIDCDVLYARTAGLLLDFCQRPPPQFLQRK
jgi:hypothetical protein